MGIWEGRLCRMGLGREPLNSTENTTTVAADELEVMYCVEKLLGSSNVWGMRRRQGRGRMGSESSRKWGEQKGPRGAASSSFQRVPWNNEEQKRPQKGSSLSCLNNRWVIWKCWKVNTNSSTLNSDASPDFLQNVKRNIEPQIWRTSTIDSSSIS